MYVCERMCEHVCLCKHVYVCTMCLCEHVYLCVCVQREEWKVDARLPEGGNLMCLCSRRPSLLEKKTLRNLLWV